MGVRTVEHVLAEHAEALMSLPGVVCAAESLADGRPCIKLYVAERTSHLAEKLPAVLDGFPVVVEQAGRIRALTDRD